MKQEEIAKLFPAHIRQALLAAHFDMEQLYEYGSVSMLL